MKAAPTGRVRCAKLHLWIQDQSATLLGRYTKAFKVSKTEAVERMIESQRPNIIAAEQDERI
jgi:hypothetical protein